MAWKLLLSCCSIRPPPNPSNRLRRSLNPRVSESAEVELRCVVVVGGGGGGVLSRGRVACRAKRGTDAESSSSSSSTTAAEGGGGGAARPGIRAALWAAEAAYVVWLFLLPYAPGDPVWAIKQSTISDLLGLSLDFFFILPLMNSVGIHLIEAPMLHPMAQGLFNFVIGWTFLFAPLLFTDRLRDRYKGSLDLLWGSQMFLTNDLLHYID